MLKGRVTERRGKTELPSTCRGHGAQTVGPFSTVFPRFIAGSCSWDMNRHTNGKLGTQAVALPTIPQHQPLKENNSKEMNE